ncbi:alkaline phosphatase-like protein [Xylona heveae TC161]|uniref:Alkaline phosphatase n=1 Tax=Xylona heveae (strain CBS 132557 / TC161) TaxID=1328760 RepID=A0A165I6P0_XYLHT|nr:alkaline phosphatase-like protein [Xylona heveae TC161]KZF24464.1 alkaline phosphatase-like protein [Xylona heveae TC161]
MAPSEQPLLAADRPSSQHSDDRDIAEEDALLTGERTERRNGPKSRWAVWREVGLFAWALLATAVVIILAVVYQHEQASHHRPSAGPKPSGKRNMIFMVSDGMGPTSLSMTRSFRQYESGLPIDDILMLDQHLIGSSRTRSSSSLVTDSAAGATAFSCGLKSYNGAISILPDHSPCGTVLEAAKRAGYMTGLVVTTRLTDATPACFAAHVNMRGEEDRIAEQEVGYYPLGRMVDLMLGGGRCHFLPNTTDGSCRKDGKDVVEMAKENGFNYVSDRTGFDGLNLGSSVKLPLLGLFADTDIPYEIDRRTQDDIYPSLDEMARTALKALSDATRDSEKGFFLMIEGSRIDHAGHGNDPAAQVHEVLAYDKAFTSVLEFLEDGVEGVVVSTSDHETGGLATARQLHETYPEYLWYPGVLANASHSSEYLAKDLRSYVASKDVIARGDLKSHILGLLKDGFGVHDASDSEVESLIAHPTSSDYIFADIISRRAQIGWTTHGHSAVDVNIYASSHEHARPLVGNHENTEVGEFIRDYLGLDLEPITKELQDKGVLYNTLDTAGENVSWTGKLPAEGVLLDECDHYHGDFKRDLSAHEHKH